MVSNLDRLQKAPSGLAARVELARRAASGDAHATSQLLQRVAGDVFRVVRGVMGTRSADVDDVAQESLIALIQALPAFRGECEPAGYACRIALRTALAARKRVHIRRSRHVDETSAEGLLAADCPGENAEANRRMELLRGLLDQIPEEQAEALTLRTVLGWSLDEIAAASGAPANTVRSRLRLAKEALRKKIDDDPALADELGL
jgi:RNA polymerase sigma factor (sigma-70 family)